VILPRARERLISLFSTTPLVQGEIYSPRFSTQSLWLSAYRVALQGLAREKISEWSVSAELGVVENEHTREVSTDYLNFCLSLLEACEFNQLVAAFNLDSKPSNPLSASIGYAIFDPYPSDAADYLPFRLTMQSIDAILPTRIQSAEVDIHVAPRRFSFNDAERLSTLYPPVPGRAGAKTHATIIDMHRALSSDPEYHVMFNALLANGNNDWEASIACSLLGLHRASAQSFRIASLLVNNPGFFKLDFVVAAKYLKELHTLYRVYRACPSTGDFLNTEQLRHLYGCDVLSCRNEKFKYEPAEEIVMRMADPTLHEFLPAGPRSSPPPSSFKRVLRESIRHSLYSAIGSEPVRLESLSDWYARRMYWAAAGSAPGATVRWATDDTAERLNKRGALLIIPESHIISILETIGTPQLFSKASPKFENGKLRPIWNTAVEHYIVQAYLLDMFEDACASDTWNSASNSAAAELKARILRLSLLSDPDSIGLMWDFSDFNINHSSHALEDLFSELAVLLRNSGMVNSTAPQGYLEACKADITRAANWVIRAKQNMFLLDPLTGFGAQVTRSLQSGERATSFTNTFLNRAYRLVHDYYCTHVFGRTLLLRQSWHQGDDVFYLVSTVADGVLACHVFNLLGFAGQNYKITLDYCSRGEFLRYSYDAEKRIIAGYPIRTYAGLIGGEFFRETSMDPGDRAMAFLDQVSDANRRGCCIHQRWLDILVARHAQISYTKPNGTVRRVNPSLELLLTPAVFGGYGTSAAAPTKFNARPAYVRNLLTVAEGSGQNNVCFNPPLAFGIASGQGKTTLAKSYPDIFCDPDDYVDQAMVAKQCAKQNWEYLNRSHRSLPYPRSQVLLTWAADTAPKDYFFAGHLVVKNQPSVRLSADNIAAQYQISASRPDVPLYTFPDFETRDAFIFRIIAEREKSAPAPGSIPLGARTFKKFTSAKRPIYQPPRVPLELFSQHPVARTLPDYAFLATHQASRVIPRVARAIITDALSGAYPARAISDSIAQYAQELDEYLATVTDDGFSSCPVIHAGAVTGLHEYASAYCSSIVGLFAYAERPYDFTVPNAGPRAEQIRQAALARTPYHDYGVLNVLVRAYGLSSVATVKGLLTELKPTGYPGQLGRLYTLLTTSTSYPAAANPSHIRRLLDFFSITVGCPNPLGTANTTTAMEYSRRCAIAFNYLAGDLSFIPAPQHPISPLVLTVVRDITLAFTQSHFSSIMYLTDEDRVYTISAVEHYVLYVMLQHMRLAGGS